MDWGRVERRHEPTADRRAEPLGEPIGSPWTEEHRLVARCRSERGAIALATQVGRYVASGGADHAAFQAMVARPDREPAVISELEIPMPASGWEIRASGLWADHICETPVEHWSYGLEAFALLIDDPIELLGRGYGERTALGWELEFEASAEPDPLGPEAYSQHGSVHGLLLFADGEVEVEGPAIRSHRWGGGAHPAASDASVDDGAGPDTRIALPTPVGVWWVSPDPQETAR